MPGVSDLWLGVDVGTTAVKAAVYGPDGVALATADAANPVHRDAEDRSEQDMAQVWSGVCQAIQAALAKIDAARIASVGICAQGDGLWTLTSAGEPNGRAMLWNDTRAADDITDLIDSGRSAAVGRACHTAIWPGTSGALYRWLGRHEPERSRAIAHVVHCADWIGHCLTGKLATDHSDGSIPFLDLRSRTYSDAALQALECGALGDRLAPLKPADTMLGTVHADAASATGLPEGAPVSVGTLDLAAMIVGMAMDRPGQTMMILGTTAVVNVLTDRVEPEDHPVGATVLHATRDVMIRVLAPTTGAAAFDWFAALHPQSLGGDGPAEIAGRLNALACDVPPGSNGVVFLPYLNGERAPFVAPRARAAFHGLTPNSTKADMGRAVMEGTAFSLRHCFEAEGGLPTAPVRLTGGGAKNALWCQIIADVIGAPVIVSDASDHGVWGAACIGAAAAGHGDACELARRAESCRDFTPDAARHRAYHAAYARYLAVSEASPAIWNALAKSEGPVP